MIMFELECWTRQEKVSVDHLGMFSDEGRKNVDEGKLFHVVVDTPAMYS